VYNILTMKKITKIIIASAIGGIAFVSTILGHINFSNVVNRGNEISQNWMKNVNGETLLSRISIPGSHDAGSLYSLGDLAGKCQDVSIKNQLNFGSRYLDIRLELFNENFRVVHDYVDQKLSFDSVINDCKDFLKYHPTETIIMSIKEEVLAKKAGAFEEKLKTVIKRDEDIWYAKDEIPKLDDVRGKLVLHSRYEGSTIGVPLFKGWYRVHDGDTENTFKINTEGGSYEIQDFFKFEKVEDKWVEVEKLLKQSATNFIDGTFTINFLSGYVVNSFPPTYSVPTARYINAKALKELKNYTFKGVVVMDFVSEDLCKAVFGSNLWWKTQAIQIDIPNLELLEK